MVEGVRRGVAAHLDSRSGSISRESISSAAVPGTTASSKAGALAGAASKWTSVGWTVRVVVSGDVMS